MSTVIPVPDATVVLNMPESDDPRTRVTPSNGFFEFDDVKSGTPYQINITAKDFSVAGLAGIDHAVIGEQVDGPPGSTTLACKDFLTPSQLLQSERSELVYDWRAYAFIANKRNFRPWKIADNVAGDDRRNAVFHC